MDGMEYSGMRFLLAKTVWVLALAAMWIAPLEAFGQRPDWQQAIDRNRQQGQNLTQQDPGRLVHTLTPEITELDVVGDSVPAAKRSAVFRLRAEWTEDAAIVNRMSELGSARDGFCMKREVGLLSDTVIGRLPGGRPLYGLISERDVEEDCYDSDDRFMEFEVPGNTNTVKVWVRTRFGSLYSQWSAEANSGVVAQ